VWYVLCVENEGCVGSLFGVKDEVNAEDEELEHSNAFPSNVAEETEQRRRMQDASFAEVRTFRFDHRQLGMFMRRHLREGEEH
jgi:hemerythrin superfamily protein